MLVGSNASIVDFDVHPLTPEARAEAINAGAAATQDVTPETRKGTKRSPQEYADPLLVLTGEEYAACSFGELHGRLCDALRDEGTWRWSGD